MCSHCKQNKEITNNFYLDKRRDKYRTICKICSFVASKRNPNYKLTAKKQASKRRERARSVVREYLSTHPCVDCGETNLLVLEFDHVRGQKSKDVSRLIGSAASIHTIAEEIAKCDVRCANCHHIKSAIQSGYPGNDTSLVKQFVRDFLSTHSCVDCGENRLLTLEFDHVRGSKYMAVSYLVRTHRSLDIIKGEIKKCDVRCCNCHRIKTSYQLNYHKIVW